MNILFICHGNICRSPIAEFIMKDLSKERDDLFISSAAVSSEEEGNDIYPPAKAILKQHNIPFTKHRAHRVTNSEMESADLVYVMDHSNYRMLTSRFPQYVNKIHMLLNRDVDDPWYSGDFNSAYNDIFSGCLNIYHDITS